MNAFHYAFPLLVIVLFSLNSRGQEGRLILIKAAVRSFEKKVARKFEWYSPQVPPSSCFKAPPTEEAAMHEQACNHSNRGRQITKTAH